MGWKIAPQLLAEPLAESIALGVEIVGHARPVIFLRAALSHARRDPASPKCAPFAVLEVDALIEQSCKRARMLGHEAALVRSRTALRSGPAGKARSRTRDT
jgi:hypothetical protein